MDENERKLDFAFRPGNNNGRDLFARCRSVDGYVGWNRPVPAARTDLVFLKFWIRQLHRDGSPAPIWILLRVIAQEVQMCQVLPDRSKCIALVLPCLGEIGLTARARRHAPENGRRGGVQ